MPRLNQHQKHSELCTHHFLSLGIGDEIGRDVTPLKLHALHNLQLIEQSFSVLQEEKSFHLSH
jgi:uncharacterized protein YnzC (UPF0291/DUF896 family)